MAELNQKEETINKNQLLFGINQGAIYTDLRIEHAKRISEMNLDGYAVGGLAVGETHEEMYHVLEETVPYLPKDPTTPLKEERKCTRGRGCQNRGPTSAAKLSRGKNNIPV